MTLQQFIDVFNILQDKYGSPNIIDSEIVNLYNMATNEYLNRMFPDSQGAAANFEADSNVTANLQPLIYTLGSLVVDVNGRISNSAIDSALATASGLSEPHFRIIAVGTSTSLGASPRPIKYAKNNNIWAYRNNSFKEPTTTQPYYTLNGLGIQLYPTNTGLVFLTVVKKPKVLTIAHLADTLEFPDYTVYNILSIALKLAGISTRDTELIEDVRNAGLQITQ